LNFKKKRILKKGSIEFFIYIIRDFSPPLTLIEDKIQGGKSSFFLLLNIYFGLNEKFEFIFYLIVT